MTFGTCVCHTMKPELFVTAADPTTTPPTRNCAVIDAFPVNGGLRTPPTMKIRPTIEFADGAVIDTTPFWFGIESALVSVFARKASYQVNDAKFVDTASSATLKGTYSAGRYCDAAPN